MPLYSIESILRIYFNVPTVFFSSFIVLFILQRKKIVKYQSISFWHVKSQRIIVNFEEEKKNEKKWEIFERILNKN